MEELEKKIQDTVAKAIEDNATLKEIKEMVDKTEKDAIFKVVEGDVKDGNFITKENSNYVIKNSNVYFKKLSPELEVFANSLKNFAKNTKEFGGGALAPVEFANIVWSSAVEESPLLSKLFRIDMKYGTYKLDVLDQSTNNYGGLLFYKTAAGGDKTLSNVTFNTLTFTAHKHASYLALTDEQIEDSAVSIISYITTIARKAFVSLLEEKVIKGTGVDEALGIINDPVIIADAVDRNAGGGLKDEDLYKLEGAMHESFVNLSFIMKRNAVATLRAQKDTVGQPVLGDTWVVFGENKTLQKTLLGYDLIPSAYCSNVGTIGDVILGDLSCYALAIRKDMTVDTSNIPLYLQDKTVVRFVTRFDGKALNPKAFKMLESAV